MVPRFHRINNAGINMIFQYDLAGVIKGRFYGGQLNKHLAAIIIPFYHILYLFKVTNGTGKTVNNCPLFLGGMDVCMTVTDIIHL